MLTSVNIDSEFLKKCDSEEFEDLFLTVINKVLVQAEQVSQAEMQAATKDMMGGIGNLFINNGELAYDLYFAFFSIGDNFAMTLRMLKSQQNSHGKISLGFITIHVLPSKLMNGRRLRTSLKKQDSTLLYCQLVNQWKYN
jgi:hypothetical protein